MHAPSFVAPHGLGPVLVIGVATAILITACGGDGSSTTPAPAPAPAPTPQPEPEPEPEPAAAVYSFSQPEVFISTRVPGTLPDGVDYAPALALVAHAPGEPPWAEGQTASDGLKILAETGESDGLLAEAEAAGATVLFGSLGQMLGLLLTPDPSIEVTLDQPCFSYAQMIAPSSDWFIGFSDVCATDGDGRWQDDIEAELLAYDAGTATGADYMFKSADTEPREAVSLLDAPPYFSAPALVQIIRAARKVE